MIRFAGHRPTALAALLAAAFGLACGPLVTGCGGTGHGSSGSGSGGATSGTGGTGGTGSGGAGSGGNGSGGTGVGGTGGNNSGGAGGNSSGSGGDGRGTGGNATGGNRASGGSSGAFGSGGAGGVGGASGSGGAAGAGGAVACGDTQSDGRNCGVCGHDCLGGACLLGVCQPIALLQFLGAPAAMAIGADQVCATNDQNGIGCARKDGSDLAPFADPALVTDAINTTPLTLDGDRLIFDDVNGSLNLSICDINDCEGTLQIFSGPGVWGSTLDPVNHVVYWADGTNVYGASTVGTPSPRQILYDGGGAQSPGAVTYANGSLVFGSASIVMNVGRSTIYRIPLDPNGASTTAVALGPGTVGAVNDTFVFTNDAQFNLNAIPLSGGGAPVLIMPNSPAPPWAADHTSLYWSVQATVATCLIADCAATKRTLPAGPLAAKERTDMIADIRTDDTAVYWLTWMDQASGLTSMRVYKLAK